MINGLNPIERKSTDSSSRSDFAMSVFGQYVLNSSSKGSAGIKMLFIVVVKINFDTLPSNLIGDAKRNAVEDVVIDCLREILSKDVDTQNVQTLLDNLIKFLEEAQKHNSNNVNQDFIDLLKLINNYLFEQTFDDPIAKMRSFANIPSAFVPPFGPSSVGGEFNPSGPSPPQGSNFNSDGDRRSTSSSSSTSHSRASSTFDSGEQPRASSTSSTFDAAKSEEFVLDRDRAIQMLGLSKQFTKSELNKAYRKKALETHPDKRKEGVSEADANEQFNMVKLSYDYLKTDFDPKA